MAIDTSKFKAFVKLGNFFSAFCDENNQETSSWTKELEKSITLAGHHNGWFTEKNIKFALKEWGAALTETNLKTWLSAYEAKNNQTSKNVAIIMAGNIPLVGFHDFISVLLAGHTVIAKLASNDKILLPFIASFLKEADSTLENRIHFTEEQLQNFDAVIATGSNNTGRYFEYYFGKHPNIIRKNRISVAVLSGNESKEELQLLGEDVFRYFGLGCRSVSKLYVPKEYDFANFYEAVFEYNDIINISKYANNYDYNKAVYLMSDFNLRDNNFLLLKEDTGYGSPIGVLFFEYYDDIELLKEKLKADKEQLQCVVSALPIKNTNAFGTTQHPGLSDYADGVDTMKFLLEL